MRRLANICAAILGLVIVAFSGGGAYAVESELESEIAADEQALEELRLKIEARQAFGVPEPEDVLRALRERSRERLSRIVDATGALKRDLDQLGPAPPEGAPAEDAALAARRDEIRAALARAEGQRTRLEANIAESAELLGELSHRRLALLYKSLLARGPPLYSGEFWSSARSGARALATGSARHVGAWIEGQERSGPYAVPLSVGALAAALVLAMLMIGPAHRLARERFARQVERLEPTAARRAALAAAKMLARLLPGLAGGALVVAAARATEFLPANQLALAVAIWTALLGFLIVEGFASGLFSTAAPDWRIAPVDIAKGRAASRLLLAVVALFGLRVVCVEAGDAVRAPDAGMFAKGASSFLIGALLVLLCRRGLWRRVGTNGEAQTGASAGYWVVLRRAGRWLGAAIAIAALLGYHRLADFASSRLYYVVLALALAWAVRALLRELANWAGRGLAKQDAAATGNDTSIFRFWTGLAIDALLILAIAPFVLVLAGFSAERLRDLIAQAFLGFRIGGLTISIAQIALAIGFFVAGLAATRLVQRGLARGPFAYSRLDVGVQSSLTTLVGYVGLAVAALIGLTALGVNLSNLAIIAGALSVGLGFGLQSVVNNFVSGLILLFERPIKVGDWVVTASGEGTVRKISVRSTEIETFDRSTIIVPNAELIAQTVTNLTHRDKLGRVTVAVGVAYGSDVEATRAILLKCANEHPDVLQHPEPFVVFKDFGASSLDFELRAFLADIGRGLQARTDLRFAIYKAFGEAGIEIPFPQQVVYIKPVSGAPETGRLRAKPEDGDIAGAAPSREPEEAEELARDD